MDMSTFRQLADETIMTVANWPSELKEQYHFLGIPHTGNHFSSRFIHDELYRRIRKAFTSDVKKISDMTQDIIIELIYELILEGKPLNPYCELLVKIRDATQSSQITGSDSREEWKQAIKYAYFSNQELSLNATEDLPHLYPKYYAIAYAVRRLKSIGFSFERDRKNLKLNSEDETRLVKKIESIFLEVGGICVVQKISDLLSRQYDQQQERYHIIRPKPKPPEPKYPLIPIGYLFQLAVKHYQGGKSSSIVEQGKINFLFELCSDYTTILEVQDYSHFPTFPYVIEKIIEILQKKALEDAIYRIPQLRGSDVTSILLGIIDDTILDKPFEKGWTIRQAISVIDIILNKLSGRGLSRIYARDVRKKCPLIPVETVNFILDNVFSHPEEGANQRFSRPNDAPNITPAHSSDSGANFSQLPLLRYTKRSYVLMNRSFCSGAFIEAIFSQIRLNYKNFDRDYLGKSLEDFTRSVLLKHGINSVRGEYWIGKTRWECDIVVETNKTIIFIEIKKKPLTRRARAGSDVAIILDLAQSLLDAQKQAGNHEMQLRKEGYLDLIDGRNTRRIELKDRSVERIALSLTDFGSFHDRIFLQKFMNAVSKMTFGVNDKRYEGKFNNINETISILQEQSKFFHSECGSNYRLYFNCWFFSLSQLMIILDGVSGPEAFREALWAIRGITTGQDDLCFDLCYVKEMEINMPEIYKEILKITDKGTTFLTGI